jgi:hypothetical protein
MEDQEATDERTAISPRERGGHWEERFTSEDMVSVGFRWWHQSPEAAITAAESTAAAVSFALMVATISKRASERVCLAAAGLLALIAAVALIMSAACTPTIDRFRLAASAIG